MVAAPSELADTGSAGAGTLARDVVDTDLMLRIHIVGVVVVVAAEEDRKVVHSLMLSPHEPASWADRTERMEALVAGVGMKRKLQLILMATSQSAVPGSPLLFLPQTRGLQ